MIDTDERLNVSAVMTALDSEPATPELKLALACTMIAQLKVELAEAHAMIDGLKVEIAGLRAGVQSSIHNPDISDLSPELQVGMVETVDAILAVLRAHMSDPERGDTGWRKQTVGYHFEHAHGHTDKIHQYEMIDSDDGLPHEDHALCRLMLAKARRKLG